MYKILIVDDEAEEREGIAFLIKKFKMELDMELAENGEKALEYILNNHVDILLTDIKMPFMDGLDLSHEARLINPKIKIIIFSAYGEFDYAKKAMQNNAIGYLVKPIEIEEFLNVITRVLDICSREKEEVESHNKMLTYEKEEILLYLVNNNVITEDLKRKMGILKLDFEGKYTNMLLIDLQERFFHNKNDEFQELLKKVLTADYEYLNLNEYQSIIFISDREKEFEASILKKTGEDLLEAIIESYDMMPFLIIGKTVVRLEDFLQEFRCIEQKLELKFFYKSGNVIFTSDGIAQDYLLNDCIDVILKDIDRAIELKDISNITDNIRLLFKNLMGSGSFSPLYVKYICVDIIRKYTEKLNYKVKDLDLLINEIFSEEYISNLEEILIRIISNFKKDNLLGEDTNKTVIRKVMDIIQKEYMTDINVESIAERVYLTPSYLSYLFKKETNQSLVKYLTVYRLEKAKDLLVYSNMRIVDIGENVGYANLSYFCMLFRNNYGMTPAKYRERVV